jgi:hypothetical protein
MLVSLFPLGQLVATRNVVDSVPQGEILKALARHTKGDWGDLDAEDKELNDLAVLQGSRLLSSYKTESGVKFWIITECDRSYTTVLFPEDY